MKRIPLKIVLIFCLLLKIDGHSQVVRIWASGAKGNASDRGEGLSIDKNNNTYLTGYYQSITSNPGEFVFGKDSFQTAFRDCFLIKFDANGNRIWARSSVGGYAWGTATATAEDNNIYITGLYEGNITFGTFNFTTIANAQDIFLAKYDQNGKQLWASSPVVTNISGYNIYNAANAVATDKSNNVYLTGSYEDQIAFGSFTLPKNPSTPGNMFLVKYGPTGNVIWAKYSSGTGTAVGNSVVTDAHNNIYVSGYFTAGTAIFGSCNVTCNTGSGFYFLTKYDSNGNAIWARTLSNAWKGTCPTPIVSSTSITIDKYNNPIIGGTEFMDSIRIGSFTLGKTKPILFTAKYDTGGNVLWAKSSTGGYSYLSNVLSMTTDKCGNIYFSVQVRVSDSVRYGSTLYKGSYVEELDSLGNSLKGIEVTNSVSDQCNVLVAIDNWGNAIIGGEFVDTLTAGKDSLKTSGGRDYPFNMKTLFNNNCCHAPQLNITGSDSVCRSIGKQVLKVFPLGANYVWSNGATTDSITIPADSGKYSVQAKNGACLEDTSISIILKPSPTVITNGTQTVCLGDTVVLTAAGGTNYTWSSGSTTSNIVVRPVSNKTYSVAVSNGICSIDTTILVTVHPKPKPIIKGNSPICFGDSTVLTAKGGTSYSWNTGATSSSLKVKPAQTSTYSVAISNSFCTVDTSISIAVKPLPNTVITGNTSICLGQSSSLTALGGASYSWSTGATESSINISPVSNSEYWVVVDTNGCTDSVFQWVIVNPLPVISACCDSNIVLGQNIQLTSSGGVNYSWVPASGLSCDNCSNPIASPAVSTIYTLTVTSDSACSSITTITIDVNCGTVFVPEAFSPNGDGQNDNLYVRGDCIKVLDFIVFDRWGKRIFETTDKDIPWDGTSKGQALNTGSYVYSLSATLYDGTNIQRKGNVALVR